MPIYQSSLCLLFSFFLFISLRVVCDAQVIQWPKSFIPFKLSIKKEDIDGFTAKSFLLIGENIELEGPLNPNFRFSKTKTASIILRPAYTADIQAKFYLYPALDFFVPSLSDGFQGYIDKVKSMANRKQIDVERTKDGNVKYIPRLKEQKRKFIRSDGSVYISHEKENIPTLFGRIYYEINYTRKYKKQTWQFKEIFIDLGVYDLCIVIEAPEGSKFYFLEKTLIKYLSLMRFDVKNKKSINP